MPGNLNVHVAMTEFRGPCAPFLPGPAQLSPFNDSEKFTVHTASIELMCVL
jgi:hypothetical protein